MVGGRDSEYAIDNGIRIFAGQCHLIELDHRHQGGLRVTCRHVRAGVFRRGRVFYHGFLTIVLAGINASWHSGAGALRLWYGMTTNPVAPGIRRRDAMVPRMWVW